MAEKDSSQGASREVAPVAPEARESELPEARESGPPEARESGPPEARGAILQDTSEQPDTSEATAPPIPGATSISKETEAAAPSAAEPAPEGEFAREVAEAVEDLTGESASPHVPPPAVLPLIGEDDPVGVEHAVFDPADPTELSPAEAEHADVDRADEPVYQHEPEIAPDLDFPTSAESELEEAQTILALELPPSHERADLLPNLPDAREISQPRDSEPQLAEFAPELAGPEPELAEPEPELAEPENEIRPDVAGAEQLAGPAVAATVAEAAGTAGSELGAPGWVDPAAADIEPEPRPPAEPFPEREPPVEPEPSLRPEVAAEPEPPAPPPPELTDAPEHPQVATEAAPAAISSPAISELPPERAAREPDLEPAPAAESPDQGPDPASATPEPAPDPVLPPAETAPHAATSPVAARESSEFERAPMLTLDEPSARDWLVERIEASAETHADHAEAVARPGPLFGPPPAFGEPRATAVPLAEPAFAPVKSASAPTSPAPSFTPAPAETRAPSIEAPPRTRLQTVVRYAMLAIAGYFTIVLGLIVAYRMVDPPLSTLMVIRAIQGDGVDRTSVPIEQISPNLVRAVIVSEDGRFCDHWGIDLDAVEQAIEKAGDGIPRGASTISMQLVKNLFLWPSKSYLRKVIELPLTVLMELAWSKRRILEIYLNVAEWGPGVFGAEAASRHHFNKPAARLSEREAALLAASLPNPFIRDAGDPGPRTARKASVVQARVRSAGGIAACVLDR